MRVVVVTPENEITLEDLTGYNDIKHALRDGWLEGIVFVPDWVVYIDEDGIAKELPSNVIATFIVELMLSERGRELVAGRPILGNAVFIGINSDGLECDLPEYVIQTYFPSLVGEL